MLAAREVGLPPLGPHTGLHDGLHGAVAKEGRHDLRGAGGGARGETCGGGGEGAVGVWGASSLCSGVCMRRLGFGPEIQGVDPHARRVLLLREGLPAMGWLLTPPKMPLKGSVCPARVMRGPCMPLLL